MAYTPNGAEIAESWLRYRSEASEADKWALFALQDEVLSNRDSAWEVVALMLRAATTEWQATMIGSGPLEDLLYLEPEKFLSLLEGFTDKGAWFEHALGCVRTEDPELQARLLALRSSGA